MLQRLALLALFLASGLAARTQKIETSDWPEYGGTLAGQRYSAESEIDRQNIGSLQIAWTFHTHALDKVSPLSNWRSSFEATPVLWNNTLYFDTPFNTIFALDAATGKLRWSFDPYINRESPIYIVTSRGVTLWHAKKTQPGVCGSDEVLMATLDRRLIARDARTGEPCPKFGNHGSVNLLQGVATNDSGLYGFTSPPTVVGDTVVLGSSVADNQAIFTASGAVRGFDATTGAQKWSWDPVRWTQGQASPTSGSGNAWSAMSADPEHDLIFVPTGSSSTDFYGGTRLGDNRDADSLVALQASTGRRIWGFQLVHHDIWDYDTPSEPVLFTFRHSIPAVAVTTKTSMVYVFNRLTGTPLYPIEERRVPASSLPGEQAWPTQPFSTLPSLTPLSFAPDDLHFHNAAAEKYCRDILGKFENKGIFTPPSAGGSIVYPGSLGGANWGSSAFDPSTSILYTRVNSVPYMVRQLPGIQGSPFAIKMKHHLRKHLPEFLGGDPPPLKNDIKTPDTGGIEASDVDEQAGSPYRLSRQAIETPDGLPCAPEPFGSIVAINLDTGKKVWAVPHGEMVKGEPGSIGVAGVIATAGGLVIGASTNDAFLRAYNSTTGEELWRGALPVSSNATPMTYAVKGRQYIVIAAGGHGFVGKGKGDEIVAFALPVRKSNSSEKPR